MPHAHILPRAHILPHFLPAGGSFVGSALGAWLTNSLGVTSDNFTNLFTLVSIILSVIDHAERICCLGRRILVRT